ncbi:hypothetical protein D046_6027A, partial [Vibrio parahaemolyticus V-223/04]
MANRCPWFCAN